MSDPDASIPQKVAALAGALGQVRLQIFQMGRLFHSFQRWYEAKGEDTILRFLDPMDGSQKDGSLTDGSEDVLDAAAEFVEAVATADQMLNSTPVSALERLSQLAGVPWDLRTRRTLRAIQHETAILECHSRDPEGLLVGLWWMGADRVKQMKSKLEELELELKERIIDLRSLPNVPTNPTIAQQGTNQESVANPNGNTQSEGGSVSQSTATEKPTETDDKLPKMTDESPPPKYDPNSVDWILSETLCDVIGIKARTIADYRKARKCGEDTIDEFGSWNVDCVGQFRRQVNRKGSVAYYRPAMSESYKAKLMYAESQKLQKP